MNRRNQSLKGSNGRSILDLSSRLLEQFGAISASSDNEFVDLISLQELSNKIFISPTITSPILGTATYQGLTGTSLLFVNGTGTFLNCLSVTGTTGNFGNISGTTGNFNRVQISGGTGTNLYFNNPTCTGGTFIQPLIKVDGLDTAWPPNLTPDDEIVLASATQSLSGKSFNGSTNFGNIYYSSGLTGTSATITNLRFTSATGSSLNCSSVTGTTGNFGTINTSTLSNCAVTGGSSNRHLIEETFNYANITGTGFFWGCPPSVGGAIPYVPRFPGYIESMTITVDTYTSSGIDDGTPDNTEWTGYSLGSISFSIYLSTGATAASQYVTSAFTSTNINLWSGRLTKRLIVSGLNIPFSSGNEIICRCDFLGVNSSGLEVSQRLLMYLSDS